MKLRSVRKRDGRDVPFDESKIRLAIERAMAAVGEVEAGFAGEVAGVVRMTLEQRLEAARAAHQARGEAGSEGELVPAIEDIQDLVEQALVELGRARLAKAYILYRDRRQRVREAIGMQQDLSGAGTAARLRVLESEGSSPWSKGRIVAALMDEAELSRELAESVAAQVERRVLAAGFRSISTGLIRGLVDNELLSRGLEGAVRRQGMLGIPRHDLRRMLREETPREGRAFEGGSATQVEGRTSAGILRRFALEEALDEDSAERHRVGDFHLVDLEAPQRPLCVALPSELLLCGEPGPEASFELLDDWVRVATAASRGAVLEDIGPVLQPLARSGRGGSPLLAGFLRAIGAAARAANRDLDLCGPTSKSAAWLPKLIVELARLDREIASPRLYLDVAQMEDLLGDQSDVSRALCETIAQGRVVPVWSSPRERFAAPACRRGPRERGAVACGGVAALNLPRLARRAGPWREDRMLELLHEQVEAALLALASLRRFQVQCHEGMGIRARVGMALAPVGLRRALRMLGDGEVRPDQGRRILGFLDDAARRGAERAHLAVTLTPWFGRQAAARFAALDRLRYPHAQGLLFEGGDSGAPQGVDTPRTEHGAFGEAAALDRSAAGSLGEVSPFDGSSPGPDSTEGLESYGSLGLARGGESYGSGFDLFPPYGWNAGRTFGSLLSTVAAGALHPAPPASEPGALAEDLRAFRSARDGDSNPESGGHDDGSPGPSDWIPRPIDATPPLDPALELAKPHPGTPGGEFQGDGPPGSKPPARGPLDGPGPRTGQLFSIHPQGVTPTTDPAFQRRRRGPSGGAARPKDPESHP